jgi:hypothetical protein
MGSAEEVRFRNTNESAHTLSADWGEGKRMMASEKVPVFGLFIGDYWSQAKDGE